MLGAVILTGLAVWLFVYLKYRSNKNVFKQCTIPGPQCENEKEGSSKDIAKAGSFFQYIADLHTQYGEIVSFWMDGKKVVSVASTKLFKMTSKLFDRPETLSDAFMPLIGEHSVEYANGDEGKKRRAYYDKMFSHEKVKNDFNILKECGEEFVTKWANKPKGEHIPLTDEMIPIIMKSVLRSLFGQFFNDEEKIKKMSKAYLTCWTIVEGTNQGKPATEENDRILKEGNQEMEKFVGMAIESRKKEIQDGCNDTYRFVDAIIDAELDEDTKLDDAVSFFVGGVHVTALYLVWCLYFLSINKEEQDKIYQEVTQVVGNEELSADCIDKLRYTKQVGKETLRLSLLSPQVTRAADVDLFLDGHFIPAKTSIIQALGVVLKDKKLWQDPERFDPTRFDPDKISKMSSFAFMPFGFAGKRQCPAYRFSYLGQILFLALLLKKFKLDIVPGQEVVPDYGLVTGVKDEVWITISPRT